jgi:hypothetical protein
MTERIRVQGLGKQYAFYHAWAAWATGGGSILGAAQCQLHGCRRTHAGSDRRQWGW